jgi:GNAT superfamily N-acetyltransferase
MIKGNVEMRNMIVDLLYESFVDNQSVNFIIKKDDHKMNRIKALMEYSFDMCLKFGEVLLSDDSNACSLILYPHLKRTTFYAIWLDVKLIFNAIGLWGIFKALKREGQIKGKQHKEPMAYLWFIGVKPALQHRGMGGELLMSIVQFAEFKELPVCLETSTLTNLPWYERFGFKVYDELEMGYKLYFLIRKLDKY